MLNILREFGIEGLGAAVVITGFFIWRAMKKAVDNHLAHIQTLLEALVEGQQEAFTLGKEANKRLEDIWQEVRNRD